MNNTDKKNITKEPNEEFKKDLPNKKIKLKELLKSFITSFLHKFWVYLTMAFISFAFGFSFHIFFTEANYPFLYTHILDPGILIGLVTFTISIYITFKIQHNTNKDAKLKQDILDEIKSSITTLLNQYQNVKVLSSFKDILIYIDDIYKTVKEAQQGKTQTEAKPTVVEMQLKIMNHSASFGRLLCSDKKILAKHYPEHNFDNIGANQLKTCIRELRQIQKNVYLNMIEAFKSINDIDSKFYITLSTTKDAEGNLIVDHLKSTYNTKYLEKLKVQEQTVFFKNFKNTEPSNRFIQLHDLSFSDYLIKEKQEKQINEELYKECTVFDMHKSTIPFQAFVTLPKDDTNHNENLYKCLLFFINDNTISSDLELSAIATNNISFVRNISKVLDAEKKYLDKYIK